ncbi:hypothetical protein THRCLA_21480 [Thraustotheca clavata]|uniref:Uncharacterized protein n=1 Tax=Thraustotheca clavata TaxID=74557 RepID=A0A1V9ZW07_9STRA|nr:hypothetical protein THRCLA_21480 [Thraustotheca clavata]
MDDRICIAARSGNLKQLELLVEEGINVCEQRWSGVTALHRACEGGHVDVIKFLLSRGADANARAAWGWYSPLHIACRYGNEEAIMILLEHGAIWNQTDKYKATPHKYAVRAGHASMAHRIDAVSS